MKFQLLDLRKWWRERANTEIKNIRIIFKGGKDYGTNCTGLAGFLCSEPWPLDSPNLMVSHTFSAM